MQAQLASVQAHLASMQAQHASVQAQHVLYQSAFTTRIRKTHYINVHSHYAQHTLCTTYIMHNMHALIFMRKQLSARVDRGTSDSARAHVVNHGQQKMEKVSSLLTQGAELLKVQSSTANETSQPNRPTTSSSTSSIVNR